MYFKRQLSALLAVVMVIGSANITLADDKTTMARKESDTIVSSSSVTVDDEHTELTGNVVEMSAGDKVTPMADEDIVAYPVEGGNIYFDKSTGTITYSDESITNVIIPKKINNTEVKLIGFRAFCNCTNLETVDIPSTVDMIDDCAFEGCINLTNIKIPDSVTSLAGDYDGGVLNGGAFINCSALKNIELPANLTRIPNNTFSGCESLNNVIIKDKIISIGEYAFLGCTGLVDIKLPDSLQSIEYGAFINCTSLASIIIPTNVQEMGEYVFENCISLEKVVLPESLSEIKSYSFSSCEMLKDIKLPSSLTSIGENAFYSAGLTKIEIPDKTENIARGAFCYCTNLETVKIPRSVKNLGEAYMLSDGVFQGCTSLQKVELEEGLEMIGNDCFAMCESLTDITIPSTVKEMWGSVFMFCTKIKTISVPEGVEALGSAFSSCSSLQSVILPESLISLDGTFSNCSSLQTIKLPKNLTSLGSYTFSYCTSLDSIDIPEGVTEIGYNAIDTCTNLKDIHFPNSMINIQLSNCTSLEHIDLPPKAETVYISDCPMLKEIVLPKSVADAYFSRCESIKNIEIPLNVKHLNSFWGCTNLEEVTLNKGLETIDSFVFSDCPNLKTLKIPSTVNKIDERAFKESSLETVYVVKGTVADDASLYPENTEIIYYDEHDHKYGDYIVTKDPTCTDNGERYRECTICQYHDAEIIPALGHDVSSDYITEREADCTEDGYKYKICTRCGEKFDEVVTPALGHDPEEDFTTINEADCIKDGIQIKNCKRCGITVDKIITPAKGHSYDDSVTVKEATYYSQGLIEEKCKICGFVNTRVIPTTYVDYNSNEDYGLVIFNVVDAVSLDAVEKADINIAAGEVVFTISTDANGKAEQVLPVGSAQITVLGQDYMPRSINITVTEGKNEIPQIGMSRKPLVDGTVTVTEMTIDEIIDAGIDTEAPENQHVFKYSITFEFTEGLDYEFDLFKNGSGKILGGNFGGGSGSGIVEGSIGDGWISIPWEDSKITIEYVTEEYFIVIYGETKWLKEMFDVELKMFNTSNTDTVENCVATINVPEGMSLAQMVDGAQNPTQSLGSIGYDSQKSAHWYLCGDKEGDYNIKVDVSYDMFPFNEHKKIAYSTKNPVHVYAGSQLLMNVICDDAAEYGEDYEVIVVLENTSDKPIYNITHSLTGAEEYVKKTYTKITDGKTVTKEVIDMLNSYEIGDDGTIYTDVLNPGDKLAVSVAIPVTWKSPLYQTQQGSEKINDILTVLGLMGYDVSMLPVKALCKALSKMEVKYFLQSILVHTLEGSTTEIPCTFTVNHVQRNSLREAIIDEALEDSWDNVQEELFLLIFSKYDDEMGTIDELWDLYDNSKTATKEVKKAYKVYTKDQNSGLTVSAWVERADDGKISDDFNISVDKNTPYTIDNGVVKFKGNCIMEVEGKPDSMGILCVDYGDGEIIRRKISTSDKAIELNKKIIDDYIKIINDNKCGDELTYTISDDILTIDGNGKMYDFDYAAPWDQYRDKITQVIIGDNVSGIGNNAFKGFKLLNNIYISTKVTEIGANAFAGCKSLEEVFIPDSVNSVDGAAFDGIAANSRIYNYSDIDINSYHYGNRNDIDVIKSSFIFGDADNSGDLTSADSAMILQKVLKATYQMPIERLSCNYMLYSDVDKNNTLTAADAAMVLQKVLKNTFKMTCETV